MSERSRRGLRVVAEILFWVVVTAAAYIASQYIVALGIRALFTLGGSWDINSTITLLVYRLAVYVAMGGLVAGALWYRYRSLNLKDLGIQRILSWKDIGLAMAGTVAYALVTIVLLWAASFLFAVNTSEAQDLGFSRLYGGELIGAFVVLVVLTPLFEELLFRGFLYGRLKSTGLAWWGSALVVSVLFGLAHGQWNVGIDVFALSMVACYLREITGSIWAGIVLHMIKNMVAFVLTFVLVAGVAGS